MEQYYLGFDAGTQSVKTAVYDIDMNLIVQDTNATILNYPHPGWVEMDAKVENAQKIAKLTMASA